MFKYQAYFWDEIDEAPKTDQGLIAAKNYGEAAKKVVAFYGKSNIISMCLEEWEDMLSKDEIQEAFQLIFKNDSEDESNV